MTQWLIVLAVSIALASGLAALFGDARASAGQRLTTALLTLSGVLALAAVVLSGLEDAGYLNLPMAPLALQRLVGLDAVQRWFYVPIAVVGPLAAHYGLGYWPQAEHPENGRKVGIFLGVMIGAMFMLVAARSAIPFLFGWEMMALAAFFLITTEDGEAAVRRAGWHYLVATHTGTLCLFAMFSLMRAASGSYDLGSLHGAGLSHGTAQAIFILGLIGFGLKAGVVGLHVWLPGAHANAPSHVSALLSGVMLKMGVFGVVRVLQWLPNPEPWSGALLLTLGVATGLYGISMAMGQHDLKRLLAFSSIENIGIIFMGLGLAQVGRSAGRPEWIVLGLGGALLHVWNHALFKALLFFCAGSVLHGTGTRDVGLLGGLAKRMPRTAIAFLFGSVAICALPPLGGLAAELPVYLGFFHSVNTRDSATWVLLSLAATALALIGALALAAFVQVGGALFLGEPRTEQGAHAHEAPAAMLRPMALVAAFMLFLGLGPFFVAPLVDTVAAVWAGPGTHLQPLGDLVPFGTLGLFSLGLCAVTAALAWFLRERLRRFGSTRSVTWDCGYALPNVRMQYTPSSLSQILTSMQRLFLMPNAETPPDLGIFPRHSEHRRIVRDTLLEDVLVPALRGAAWAFSYVRVLQRGRIQAYFLYIILTVAALLFWR